MKQIIALAIFVCASYGAQAQSKPAPKADQPVKASPAPKATQPTPVPQATSTPSRTVAPMPTTRTGQGPLPAPAYPNYGKKIN
jgi:hypothetical protein